MIKTEEPNPLRVSQGDVFSNVDYVENVVEKNGIIVVSKIIFPLIIVLTQDCDLQQDEKLRIEKREDVLRDQKLLSVLVAPLYNAEHVFNGEHLSELNISSQLINKNKSPGNFLMTNQNPRYHYLEFPGNIPVVPSIIDFKHYFSVNVDYLREISEKNKICKVSELYREDISQRFAAFLARIGLP